MNFKFIIENDLLKTEDEIVLYSGNMNTYAFEFQFSEKWEEFIKYAIFIKNKIAYNILISDNRVLLPAEIMESPGDVLFGVFGNFDGDMDLRISTNMIAFKVDRGAYYSGNAPTPPSQDIWEQLVTKTIPVIGENGNWHIYDMNNECYVDTGTKAWTETDFVLIPTIDESGNITPGTTFEEVKKAYEEGKNIYIEANYGELAGEGISMYITIPLNVLSDKTAYFGVTYLHTRVNVRLFSDNTFDIEEHFIGDGMIQEIKNNSDMYPSAQAVKNYVDTVAIGEVVDYIEGDTLLLKDRQIAQLGELSTLTVSIPYEIEKAYESCFCFICGETPTDIKADSVIIWRGDDCDSDGNFTPQANTIYEVSVKYIGDKDDKSVIVARVGAV